jgi:16S rRNA (cytidine1402-2'-O)-methyltransferase
VDADSAAEGAPRGRLYMCATPIGNLGDASARLRDVLGSVQVVACEDTRRTRQLLSALGVPAPRLLAHHAHNERTSARGLLELLEQGRDVAVVSDAGTPGVADPGAEAVRAALDAGIEVVAVPGPSAVAAAVSVAGCGAEGHTFVGFLPRSERELRALLLETAHQVVVALEAPGRVAQSLAVVADAQPERRVVLARELTKRHEQVRSGTAGVLAAELATGAPLGEHVLVLDALAPAERDAVDARTVALVVALVEEGMRMKTAAKVVAGHAGVSQRELYELTLRRRAAGAAPDQPQP